MAFTKSRLSVNRKYLGGIVLLAFMAIACLAFSITGNDDFEFARREVLLRRIGHEVLLQSGDSTSRVLPVKKVSENEYRVSFEKAFTFQPGSLVNITRRVLDGEPVANDYVVNVLNCADASVAYAYAVSGNTKNDIITCIGRKQPVACYMIDIKFKSAGIITKQHGYLVGSLAALAFVGLVFFRPHKRQAVLPAGPVAITAHRSTRTYTVGSMLFDVDARKLSLNEIAVDLTKTETRVLNIFASSPNEIIERSRLQKEIWEDEGVIVGRSLDMFISKLRKKLELDPAVRIVVIRGKGYKLEVNT